jgi:hypothetical protein
VSSCHAAVVVDVPDDCFCLSVLGLRMMVESVQKRCEYEALNHLVGGCGDVGGTTELPGDVASGWCVFVALAHPAFTPPPACPGPCHH